MSDAIGLQALMDLTEGDPSLKIGIVDGPVRVSHPALDRSRFQAVGDREAGCRLESSAACVHGTFIAGILGARRDTQAPAICPACGFLVWALFGESSGASLPVAAPDELAQALVETVDAGARLVNLSASMRNASLAEDRRIAEALDHAASREAIVIVAAGDEAAMRGSALTRHPMVVAVAASDEAGRPLQGSNLCASSARRGVSVPAASVVSLGADGGSLTLGGSSAAAAIVTGVIALLWTLAPRATAAELRHAIDPGPRLRRSVVPPPLDAARALAGLRPSRRWHG